MRTTSAGGPGELTRGQTKHKAGYTLLGCGPTRKATKKLPLLPPKPLFLSPIFAHQRCHIRQHCKLLFPWLGGSPAFLSPPRSQRSLMPKEGPCIWTLTWASCLSCVCWLSADCNVPTLGSLPQPPPSPPTLSLDHQVALFPAFPQKCVCISN